MHETGRIFRHVKRQGLELDWDRDWGHYILLGKSSRKDPLSKGQQKKDDGTSILNLWLGWAHELQTS